jgi:homoserine kinase
MFRLQTHPAEAPRLSAVYDLGTVGLVAGLAGSIVSAGSSILGGMQENNSAKAQANAADMEAEQMAQNAGQQRAEAQQEAIAKRREARLAQSRNQAVAAASGGGADDPGVLDINSDIAGEGEFNALTALYQGEARARGMEGDSAAKKYEAKSLRRAGSAARTGSFIGAGASLLSGAGSTLLYKYG